MPATDAIPTLATDRLLLRAHHREDFADVRAMWGDPAVVRHISGQPSTATDSWGRLLKYVGHWQLMGFGFWAVIRKSDGAFLGEVGAADHHRALDPPRTAPETGWVFKPDAHGQGYASEAMAAALGWIDRHVEHDQTFCIIAPAHAASIRLARKLGYGGDERATFRGEPALLLFRNRPRRHA